MQPLVFIGNVLVFIDGIVSND